MSDDKKPILTSPNYTVYIEEYHGELFIHCDVYGKWTPSLRKELYNKFQNWFESQSRPVFAIHEEHQGKRHLTWLKIFNFYQVGEVSGVKIFAKWK